MCVSIVGPLGVPLQLYAFALAGGGPLPPKNGAPAGTLRGLPSAERRPHPNACPGIPARPAYGASLPRFLTRRGFPQGPLAWRLCRLLPHPAGAPVYSKTLNLSGLNPAGRPAVISTGGSVPKLRPAAGGSWRQEPAF